MQKLSQEMKTNEAKMKQNEIKMQPEWNKNRSLEKGQFKFQEKKRKIQRSTLRDIQIGQSEVASGAW